MIQVVNIYQFYRFDEDLVINSKKPIETLVKVMFEEHVRFSVHTLFATFRSDIALAGYPITAMLDDCVAYGKD